MAERLFELGVINNNPDIEKLRFAIALRNPAVSTLVQTALINHPQFSKIIAQRKLESVDRFVWCVMYDNMAGVYLRDDVSEDEVKQAVELLAKDKCDFIKEYKIKKHYVILYFQQTIELLLQEEFKE